MDLLYSVFIRPIELVLEIVFVLANNALQNPGLSIVVLSFAVNMMAYPLYRRADAIQKSENIKSNEMSKWVNHIRKSFKGDERYLMLKTYYRQMNYNPLSVVCGSLPLLLQVPFFVAAYHFLSNLAILKVSSFGPVANLGAPDGLMRVAGVSINLFP